MKYSYYKEKPPQHEASAAGEKEKTKQVSFERRYKFIAVISQRKTNKN